MDDDWQGLYRIMDASREAQRRDDRRYRLSLAALWLVAVPLAFALLLIALS